MSIDTRCHDQGDNGLISEYQPLTTMSDTSYFTLSIYFGQRLKGVVNFMLRFCKLIESLFQS